MGKILKKLGEAEFNNSLRNMIATLYNGKAFQDTDVEELRKFLDELDEMERGKK